MAETKAAEKNFGELAISDIGTKLYSAPIAEDGTVPATGFTQLVPIKATPATGGEPANLDATEMDMSVKGAIPDRQEVPTQTFTFNATETKYQAVKMVDNGKRHAFLVVYADGQGALSVGKATVFKNALSVGAVLEGTLSITAESMKDLKASETATMIA